MGPSLSSLAPGGGILNDALVTTRGTVPDLGGCSLASRMTIALVDMKFDVNLHRDGDGLSIFHAGLELVSSQRFDRRFVEVFV